jgi:hypothetical protein
MCSVQSDISSWDAGSGLHKSRSTDWQLKRIKDCISWELSPFMNICRKNQKRLNKSHVYVHFRFNFNRIFHIWRYTQVLQALALNFYNHLKDISCFWVNVEATTNTKWERHFELLSKQHPSTMQHICASSRVTSLRGIRILRCLSMLQKMSCFQKKNTSLPWANAWSLDLR